jgi:hypothetical protein
MDPMDSRRNFALPVLSITLALCCPSQSYTEEPAAPAAMPTAAELFADQPKGLSDHTVAWKL